LEAERTYAVLALTMRWAWLLSLPPKWNRTGALLTLMAWPMQPTVRRTRPRSAGSPKGRLGGPTPELLVFTTGGSLHRYVMVEGALVPVR